MNYKVNTSDNIFNKHTRIITQIVILIMVLSLIANYFYRNSLYQLGQYIIEAMQDDHGQIGVYFFTVVTFLSQPGVIFIIIILLMLIEKQKKHNFNIVMFFLLNIFFITLLKSFYSDPRPFWTDQNINSLGPYCPAQFGNPSGHSWFVTVASFVFLLEYFPHFSKFFGFSIIALTIIFVPLSRMYLGVHSLNQVVMGVLMGLSMNCLYFFGGLKQLLQNFMQNFNNQPMLGWKKYMVLFHLLSFLTFFLTNQKINKQSNYFQTYTQNIMNQCGTQINPNLLNFSMLLANSIIINFCTGIALGYDSMSSNQKGRNFLDGKWEINEQRHSQKIGRIMYFATQLIMLGFGFGCSLVLFIFFKDFGQIYIYIVLSIGSGLSGYCYSGKTSKLLYHYSIIIQTL